MYTDAQNQKPEISVEKSVAPQTNTFPQKHHFKETGSLAPRKNEKLLTQAHGLMEDPVKGPA